MKDFSERKKGVFVSNKIIFQKDGKTVCKVKGDTELDIAPKWPLTLFRYMPFSRLYTELENKTMTFLSPKLWKDPFESAFLDLWKGIDLKCLCFTYNGSIGEEWAWKAYAVDEQLVRIEVLFDKLVDTLSNITQQKGSKCCFYICVCDYSMDKKTLISYKATLKKQGCVTNLEDILNIMSNKRKAFAGEREIRIFAIDRNSNNSIISFNGVDYRSFTTRILLEPLNPFEDNKRRKYYSKMQDIHNLGIKEYLKSLSIKTQQSHLYEMK